MLAHNNAQAWMNHRVNVLFRQSCQRIGNLRQDDIQSVERPFLTENQFALAVSDHHGFQRAKIRNQPGQHRQQFAANLQLLENIKLCGAVFNAFDFKFHLLKLPKQLINLAAVKDPGNRIADFGVSVIGLLLESTRTRCSGIT